MKVDLEAWTDEPGQGLDEAIADPFAVDLFAGRGASAKAAAAPAGEETSGDSSGAAWHARLPRVTREQARLSAALAALPAEFYERVADAFARTLARYAALAPDDVSIVRVESGETEPAHPAAESRGAPRVRAAISVEPGATPVVVELEARFASMLIDRMLGGDGSATDTLRPLTTAERAVAEFLWLSAIDELNKDIGEPLLRLDRVVDAATDDATEQATDAPAARGVALTLRVGVSDIVGLARVYLSESALAACDAAHRKLIAAAPAGSASANRREKVALSAARVAPDVAMNVVVGETELAGADVLALEWGDVVVIERPAVVWRDGQLRGDLRVRVGDGDNSLIFGRVAPEETEGAPAIKFIIGQTVAEKGGTMAERFDVGREAEDEGAAAGTALVEGVMLTIHVELAARRLRVDELSRLRPNQILDLGCKATDPVALVVDGRRVARGELVDIEGRLGVRLTHVSS